MANFFVYLAVIVCGASVLAIELLGTRIIAPFYGGSLYLWSALISVTLAALSLGYWLGGRWADRGASLTRLCWIIGLAGVWITVSPWLRGPVFALAEHLELRLAVLFIATVLFFPPLALLGMVSPYAIRMKASSLDVVGRTAGNLYAISTVASVVAALLTGFVLIPNVGVTVLAVLVGIVLLATALLGFLFGRHFSGAVAVGLLIVAAGACELGYSPDVATSDDFTIIAVEQSAYAEIRVVDADSTRFMLIDGAMHTGLDQTTGESSFPYVHVIDLVKDFVSPGRMLQIGLGGGSTVRSFFADGWKVDAVEIDPMVTRLAHQYFGLADSEATIYSMDGRQYLKNASDTYDVILLDAFGAATVPFHLVTDEVFGLIRSRLAPGGVFAINVQSLGWNDKIVRSLAKTSARYFAHNLALPTAEPPDHVGNLILLLSDRGLTLSRDLPVPLDRQSAEYDRAHAWDNRFVVDTTGALIITDNCNPVDIWSERVNHAARAELHETFRGRRLAW